MSDMALDPDSGRLHITRLSDRKSWVNVYEKKVQDMAEVRQENYVPPERKNLALSIAMGSVIAKRMGKHVRRRLRDKKYSCRRTIDNIVFPKSAQQWNAVLGTQLICDICGLSGLFDCTACRTCNAIAHRLCVGQLFGRTDEQMGMGDGSLTGSLQSTGLGERFDEEDEEEEDEDEDEDEDSADGDGAGSEDGDRRRVSTHKNLTTGSSVAGSALQSGSMGAMSYSVAVGQDQFVCGSCRLNEEEDHYYHDTLYEKLQGERRYVLACRVVARRILAYVERSRFKKLKRGLVLIQSCIRKRRAKRWLFFLRRNNIRVVILDVQEVPPGLRPTDIICVTAVDPMKHGQQYFRFDKTADAARQEGYFIPGITAMMTLVVTILRLEEHTAGTSYFMMQQAQLAVRDGDYNERRPYALIFSKMITWVPQDPRGDYSGYHLRPAPDKAKGDKMEADKPWLQSDIIIESDVYAGHDKTATSHFHDEIMYKEAMALQKKNAELGIETKAVAVPAHMLEIIDHKQAAAAKLRQKEELYWKQFEEMTGGKIRLFYAPLNPCSSLCLLVSGPPLEELRRPPETDLRLLNRKAILDPGGEIKLKTMVEGRTSIWWLCLCYLRLYFFQYHGDTRPRLVADVTDATVEVSPEYANKCVVRILMADKRSWLVEFEDFKKAQHFEFAVKESQEGFRTVGGSLFINTKDVRSKKRDYGHNQPIL